LDDDSQEKAIRAEHVRALREGHGANCSSVGSVIDTLFVGAVAGGALLAVIAAAIGREPVRVVGARNTASTAGTGEDPPAKAGQEDA
jgi:hypothetical protein